MAGLRTVFPFTLPKGYVDEEGNLHRDGEMRLATARDEIEPLRDRAIDGPDDPYVTVLVLSRVVTRLGSLASITPSDIEGVFAADLAFLQDLYGIINFGDQADVAALQESVLPAEDYDSVDAGDNIGDGDNGDANDDGGDGAADAADAGSDDSTPREVAERRRSRSRVEEMPRPEAS